MKKFFAIALVAGVAQVTVMRAQTAPQSDVVKADEALTRALVSGDKAAAEKMRDAENLDQRAINTYGGRSASKKDRFAGMMRAQQQNPNRPEIGAAPVAFGRAWDFGESVLWVQLQPTYGDKPYWSSRVYANINGTWQMAESYHTYIKDAPVMAPVPVSAT